MYITLINDTPTPYTFNQLRKDNPNVSFPKEPSESTLNDYGVYTVTVSDKPEFNSLTETLKENYELIDGVWYKNWIVEQKPNEEIIPKLIQSIEYSRYQKETGGILWNDASGDTWFIDTKTTSQNRISGSVAAIQNGMRVENDVWKCAKVADGSFTLTYRPTANAEMLEWADLVFAHIQKCFTAESNAVAKVMQGDYTATFDAEFALLQP